MRLVLVQPPIEDFYSTAIRLQPIGIAYLKAVIKQHFPSVEVILKDWQQGYGRRTLSLPDALKFLRKFYQYADQSPLSTFYQYYRFGATVEQAICELRTLNPDLVGISMLFTAYAPQALELAEAIKRELKLPILLGGSHASAAPKELIKLPFVDFVISGEGERPIVEFVRQWLTAKDFYKVPNLVFKNKNGNTVFNKIEENFAIDEIPFPDFSDLAAENYRLGKRRLSFLISSRSCPYRCAFCSVHQTFGHSFRMRSVANIVEEIALRLKQGAEIIDFEDDNLNFDSKRFKELCLTIKSQFAVQPLRLLAMNGLSYFRLDKGMLDLMQQAGFSDLNLSLVSTNSSLLKELKRPFDLAHFEKLVQRAHQLGMRVISYLILGLPGEPLASMIEGLAYLAGLPVVIGVSPFYVTPKMAVGQNLQLKKFPSWVYGRLTTLGATDDETRRPAIFTLFIIARIVNFLKEIPFDAKQIHLQELLQSRHRFDRRTFLGLEILERLLKEQQFYVFDGREFQRQPLFNVEIFKRFQQKCPSITRIDGGKVHLGQLK